MLTQSEYEALKARSERYDAWAKQFRKPNGWTVIPADASPPAGAVTNDERSALELYEFCRDQPEKYFLYIDAKKHLATTWTGDKLGDVQFGRVWRDNFGGRRRAVTIRAINGATYSGTYYESSGDYARIRKLKRA